jgi:hypothetical protein
MRLADRLIAAANGDVPWRKRLLLEAASAIEARMAETHSGSVEDESAGPKDDAQNASSISTPREPGPAQQAPGSNQ